MCFLIYFSTDSDADLSGFDLDHLTFRHPSNTEIKDIGEGLQYEHKWFVSTYGGCSCHLRNLVMPSVSLGFGPPLDWYPEEEDNVKRTGHFYDVLLSLVDSGARVDLVSCWSEAYYPENDLTVSLKEVGKEAFRIFEEYRFEFVP